jgi:hypothetical protein
MKLRNILIATVVFFELFSSAQERGDLSAAMGSLKVNTALIFPSQAVDDSPLWSPDSRYLAGNVQGSWYKVQIGSIQLKPARWHDHSIGVIADGEKFEKSTEQEVKSWAVRANGATRKTVITAAVEQDGLSSALVLTNGKRKVTLWRSDVEACGGLTQSPDGRFVAYICETNGILVTELSTAFNQR